MSEEPEEKTTTLDEEVDVADLLDLSKKKKKKKSKGGGKSSGGAAKNKEGGAGAAATTTGGGGLSPEVIAEQQRLLLEQDQAQEINDPDDPKANYTYDDLLERVVGLLQVRIVRCMMHTVAGLDGLLADCFIVDIIVIV